MRCDKPCNVNFSTLVITESEFEIDIESSEDNVCIRLVFHGLLSQAMTVAIRTALLTWQWIPKTACHLTRNARSFMNC